jgi:N-terminal half of MaoC dehydratase
MITSMITDEIRARVGIWSEPEFACDPVEQGAVRRFAQAVMDDDPDYGPDAPRDGRHGGPVAPLLFPNHMLRRAFGTPDLIQQRADDADFDGVVPARGLPPLDALAALPVLNGGSEFEFFRHARFGERVNLRQRYADIHEKTSAKGSIVFVVIESEIRGGDGGLLLRARRTLLRRVA